MRHGLFLFLLILSSTVLGQKKNVVLIIVDDLRADLDKFCTQKIHKPSIDKLSEEGISFNRAYCQKALCVPSRQSFLTGMRPNKFGAGFNDHFRKKLPEHLTLPQYFKGNGYKCISVGKVFHHRDPISWSEPSWVPDPPLFFPIYGTQEAIKIQQNLVHETKFFPKGSDWWAKGGKWVPSLIWEAPEVNDNQLTDGKLADYAIERINKLKDSPFFLAVGFFRPHLPFIAPKKYFDLYPLNSIKLPENGSLPNGTPKIAAQTGGEWRSYYKVHPKSMPSDIEKKEYIRAYLASVSYVDAQIGRLVKSIEESNLVNNTIFVLMSDHGYHLFDNSSFGKSTNFEDAVRVHLAIKSPGSKSMVTSNEIVELIDLYPTLCDLTGLGIPQNLDGLSFAGIFNDRKYGKKAAYSQYSRNGFNGLSVRTEKYRFTQWQKGKQKIEELYDFNSPKPERENLVNKSEFKEELTDLRKLLKSGF